MKTTSAVPGSGQPAPTVLFAGRYLVQQRIGRGRSATVYIARDTREAQLIALKIFRGSLGRDAESPERLARLAATWRRIADDHVVLLHDSGIATSASSEPTNLRPYLALEHVAGRSLAWYVHARGALPVEHALDIATQTLRGLVAIHDVGLVHGDLRPGDILLSPNGVAKIADPGLAKIVGHSGPDYLAPEQAAGQVASPASDIYSLGVILFELLVDDLPFAASTPADVLAGHASKPVPSPRRRRPAVSAEIEAIVLRALAKRPEERFGSAAEMRLALVSLPGTDDQSAEAAPWSAMLAAREDDLAPAGSTGLVEFTRQPRPQSGDAINRRHFLAIGGAALGAAAALVVGSGRHVRIGLPWPAETPAEHLTMPVAEESPTPEPAFVPVARAEPTSEPSPTSRPGPRPTYVAPYHPNPAIAEAFRIIADDAPDTNYFGEITGALDSALAHEVDFRFGQPPGGAYGVFEPSIARITLAQMAANQPARARAALLVHELIHVRDFYAGGLSWGSDVLACYDVELRAFRIQAAFWRVARVKRPRPRVPSTPLEVDLEHIARVLDQGSAEFVAKDLVGRYGASCKPPAP